MKNKLYNELIISGVKILKPLKNERTENVIDIVAIHIEILESILYQIKINCIKNINVQIHKKITRNQKLLSTVRAELTSAIAFIAYKGIRYKDSKVHTI